MLADSDDLSGLQVILLASGSELQIAVAARETLQAEGIGTRVVSVPCLDWFEVQDSAYIESVLPSAVTARVSIEAAISQPWWRWLGTHGRPVSLEHYGASADAKTLYKEFGITAEARRRQGEGTRWHRWRPGPASAPHRHPSNCTTRARTTRPRNDSRREHHTQQLNSSTPPLFERRPDHGPPWEGELIIMTTPQSTNNPLADLSAAGVSLWLDDLSRQRLQSGNLKDLIDEAAHRRGHHQPVDLPGRAQGRRVLPEADR